MKADKTPKVEAITRLMEMKKSAPLRSYPHPTQSDADTSRYEAWQGMQTRSMYA